MTRNKWSLAIVAGAFTTALIGGVALGGFQPFAGSNHTVVGDPTIAVSEKDPPKAALKAILDSLIAKNTITQAQEDAILKALAEAQPAPRAVPKPPRPTVPNVKSFIGDVTKAAGDYLGMDLKTLLTELRGGKSLADIANGLSSQGKSASGLIDALTKAANSRLDRAVAANTLTANQAASLKPKIAAEIVTFVNRSFTAPVLPRPLTPVKPTPSPKS
jgi:hypothetical protein